MRKKNGFSSRQPIPERMTVPSYTIQNTLTYGSCRAFIMLWLTAFSLIFFFICLSPQHARAAHPEQFIISSPTLRTTDAALLVDLSCSVDNEDGLRALLKDGAVLTLTLDIAMERNRSWWANASVLTTTYTSRIQHDQLTREFTVTIPTLEGDVVHHDRNLTRLLNKTWRQLSLPVIPLKTIAQDPEDTAYTIALTVQLQHSEVPPWLEKSLVFWSSSVVPSQSFTLPYTKPASQ